MVMTRDEFEALYASIPADELRTVEDDIICLRLCPTPEHRKAHCLWALEHLVPQNHPVYQLMLDEQTFTDEDWIKLCNVVEVF